MLITDNSEVEVISMNYSYSWFMSLAKHILGQDATTFHMCTWHEQAAVCH